MNISMDKRKMAMVGAVVIIVALAVVAKFYFLKKIQSDSSVYSVAYLTTGEIYIGHLSTWPRMELRDAYLLQTVKDNTDATKTNIQLTPLKEALWAPKYLYLNEKNVIFYGPIEEGSKAAEAIRGAGK
jgi:hypothetical protein